MFAGHANPWVLPLLPIVSYLVLKGPRRKVRLNRHLDQFSSERLHVTTNGNRDRPPVICSVEFIRWSTGNPTEGEKGLKEPECSYNTIRHHNKNHRKITETTDLNQQLRTFFGKDRDTLHILYTCVAWISCVTSNNEYRECPQLICWLFRLCSSHWVSLPSPSTWEVLRLTATLYAMLISTWDLSFPKFNGRGADWLVGWWRDWEKRREGNIMLRCKIKKNLIY